MVLLRKKHRLNKDNYIGTNVYSVTIASDLRKYVFTSKKVIDEHVRVLNQACEKYKFDVIVYCFMPDHLHLLLQGRHSNSHLVNFIKNYKQITGHGYKAGYPAPFMAKKFL